MDILAIGLNGMELCNLAVSSTNDLHRPRRSVLSDLHINVFLDALGFALLVVAFHLTIDAEPCGCR